MKFRCASNAAIKNVKIARKKNQLFFQNIFNKIAILKKIQIFRKHKVYMLRTLREEGQLTETTGEQGRQ